MDNLPVEAIKPKGDYREIIEVNAPIRFFWNPDGTFDGIEFSFEIGRELFPWEEDMINQCLEAISSAIEDYREAVG